jgi:hypothetical protein
MSRSSEWGRPDRATDSWKEQDRARLIHERDDYPGVVDGDAVSDLSRRYWSLVVTACEWRAFEVEAPEAMAERVFASLNPGKVLDLRAVFRGVDDAVAEAYRRAVSGRSSLDAIRGMATTRRDFDRPVPLIALSSLREGDRRLLQHAYWDDLDPAEIATVLRTDVGIVQRRLDDATRRYAVHLARRHVELVDDVASVLSAIKPGTHRRRP